MRVRDEERLELLVALLTSSGREECFDNLVNSQDIEPCILSSASLALITFLFTLLRLSVGLMSSIIDEIPLSCAEIEMALQATIKIIRICFILKAINGTIKKFS